jgi:hypothetical protein
MTQIVASIFANDKILAMSEKEEMPVSQVTLRQMFPQDQM